MRIRVLLFWVTLVFSLTSVRASLAEEYVALISIEQMILPGTAHYLEESIDHAEQTGARALVVRLNTPGGMLQSSQEMIQSIFRSQVPVIIYIAPTGATATSAGVFITLAGHVAAMAPGTTIGAAHPVSGEGKDIEGDMRAKIENMTSALVRSIATERGRNVEWAEKAVRESVSITDREALERKVVDLIAEDLPGLLRQVKGMTVTLDKRQVELGDYSALPLRTIPMSVRDQVVNVLANPSVLALLWLAATTGISIELYHPGAILPGVVGAISLILALAMGQIIPVSQGAVLLLILGALLLGLELFVTSGVLGVGGIIAMVLGALYLVDPVVAPGLEVDRVFVGGLAFVAALTISFIVRTVIRAQSARLRTGAEGLVGVRGKALQNFSERGKVQVQGEIWKARNSTGLIEKGDAVEVLRVSDGLTLEVRKVIVPIDSEV